MLDEAGIARAVVLSTAYQLGNPNRPAVPDEYQRVIEENDWTAAQVAAFPKRLIGFCGFNPLKDYALAELERCAGIPALATGIKLHFGNSDVNLDDPDHVRALQRVFAAANAHRMAIVVHLRPSVTRQRPYGAQQAREFLEQVLPTAPHVVVQIAHLGGAGSYDAATDAALEVFAGAAARHDPRMKRVYLDISGVAGIGEWQPHAAAIVAKLRTLGMRRVLYGSDGAANPDGRPLKMVAALHELPLTATEFAIIDHNTAPYLHGRGRSGRP
jgi:predicted TIM-barrel fold metal-dependent hydrolase